MTTHEGARELVQTIQRLSLVRSTGEIQAIVRTAARRLTAADGAALVLRDGPGDDYVDDAGSPPWNGRHFTLETCVSAWSMRNHAPAVVADVRTDKRIPDEVHRPAFVKSLAMMPIRPLDPVGAIGSYWTRPHQPTDTELELLQALADSTAVALENVRAYEEPDDARLETLERLALAAEYRDDATYEHTRRVARASRLLGERLGLPAPAVSLIEQAAPLHDIGKVAVSHAVLLKSGRLSDEEIAQMREHAGAGAAILSGSGSEVLRLAREIALSHHEWWDGSGYPRGLRAGAIPLSGRIVALADVFDALTHARPYKRAWPLADAVTEVSRLAGEQFDPAVVAAFEGLDPARLVAPVGSAPAPASLARTTDARFAAV